MYRWPSRLRHLMAAPELGGPAAVPAGALWLAAGAVEPDVPRGRFAGQGTPRPQGGPPPTMNFTAARVVPGLDGSGMLPAASLSTWKNSRRPRTTPGTWLRRSKTRPTVLPPSPT